jgi:hypothetical protein
MIMKKIFEFLIGEDDDTGVKTISLVDAPAMESEFLAFSTDVKKPQYISLEEEGEKYKQVVGGLSMIPDKLIYRVDPETQEEYYGYFSQETIEKIRNKYHKEMMTSNVNTDHNENQYIEAYLIESYILSTEARVEEVKAQGIEGATLGAWYTQFKIEDEEIFQKVLDGEFKGFSIEAFLNKEFKTVDANLKNNFNKKEKKMKKNIIERFKEFLTTLENEDEDTQLEETQEQTTEDKNFEEALVPEEGFTIIWNEVGEVVQKRYENEAGEEVLENVGQGEFALESGEVVVVDEDSNLIEVRPAEEEAPVEEQESTEEQASEETEVKAEETQVAEEAPAEEKQEEGMPEAVKAWITGIAGEFDDGEIYVSFMKQAGELTYGSVSTYANIKMSEEKDKTITDLEKQVEELKEKLSEPITEPRLDDTSRLDEGDVKELTVYQRVAKRKGLATM